MEGDAFREILRAVSQENPETIARKVHEAFCDRDLEAVVALWAEGCEYEPALEREIGDEGVFRRHDVVIEAPFFELSTIRGGKIVASRDFFDRDDALEAAGLSE